MRRMMTTLAAALLAFVNGVQAGGPKLVARNGPILWDATRPIEYKIDQGDLGTIPAARISRMIQDAFEAWNGVPSASISLRFSGAWDHDIVSAEEATTLLKFGESNVVVLDRTGDFIDDFVGGEGQKELFLGGARPIMVGPRIERFFALFNGYLARPDRIAGTLVHETGHAIGLDHSQIQWSFADDRNLRNDGAVPRMFPQDTDSERYRPLLHADDIAWLSRLYPARNGQKSHGTLKGRLVRAKLSPLLGANVVAVNQNDPENLRFSCISDYLGAKNGEFEIPVVPGNYILLIEPVRPQFYGMSSVGLYADKPTSESFANPIAEHWERTVRIVAAGNSVDVGVVAVP